MTEPAAYHAHVYYTDPSRDTAEALRERFRKRLGAAGPPQVLFVGAMADRPVGPHPEPQYEVHFTEPSLPDVVAMIEATGLRALVHPLTDDDLADHTTLGRWIGEPLPLDHSVLDPPGLNQGVARFGKSDF